MSNSRRTLGTGPRPDDSELSPNDNRERARTAAERAAAEPTDPSEEGQLPTRPQGRRRLGTGPERDQPPVQS